MNQLFNSSTWELSERVLNLKPTWATQLRPYLRNTVSPQPSPKMMILMIME